VNKSGDQEAQY